MGENIMIDSKSDSDYIIQQITDNGYVIPTAS